MNSIAGSLDTNILLRLLLNDVPAQHEAAVALLNNTPGQLAVSDIALAEVVFVLGGEHYGFSRLQIGEALEGVMALQKINCNRALFAKALPLFLAHPALSFEDCCLAAYAVLNSAEPLWTFDKKLANQVPMAMLLA